MITVTSNNFGLENYILNDFQKDGLVVLNGRLGFDPSNEEYKSASVLELKVSDLSISKSTNATVYLIDFQNEMPHATILRAWIRDCNTICIEPCRCFDDRPYLDIVFCSGFVAKGIRSDLVLDEVIRPTVAADSGTFKLDGFPYYQQLFIKDNRWGFLALLFDKFQAPEVDKEFSFTVPELPDNVNSYGVLAIGENYQSIGTPVCICTITGPIVHCTPVKSYCNYGNEGRFMLCWFLLDARTE